MTTPHATPARTRRLHRLSRRLGVAATTVSLAISGAITGMVFNAAPASAASVPVATVVRTQEMIAPWTVEYRTTLSPVNWATPVVGGSLPQQQIAGTRPVWDCDVDKENLTSLDPTAEHCAPVQLLGYIYTSPPGGGMPSWPLYRCTNGDHFDSIAADCEGKGTQEGLLGYLEARARFSRYVTPSGDYLSSTIPASYWSGRANWDADGGYLATKQVAGTRPVYECVVAWDLNSEHYTSLDAACEGPSHQMLSLAGYAFAEPIPNVASTPLYRCITPGGEHFDTVNTTCDGKGKAEVFIGYLQSL